MIVPYVRYAIAACAMVFAIAGTPAMAAPKTYEFEGRLTWTGLSNGSHNADWAFSTGDVFSGTLVYDPSAIDYSYDVIDTPGFTLTFHRSPIISLNYEVMTAKGNYSYSPPVAGGYAAVGSASEPGNWSGVNLRFQNYQFGGEAPFAVPDTGYVGDYYPHSSFLYMYESGGQPLPSTSADLDLVALFNALPPSPSNFSVRFSNPLRWKEDPSREQIDGVIDGRIESFNLVQSAVPEPSTWGMMLLGFGAIGGVMRRHSHTRKAVLSV